MHRKKVIAEKKVPKKSEAGILVYLATNLF
jgi:hypothetical protein